MLPKRADDANPIVLPQPYVWKPSGKWDGNDGKWSSFMVNIGATDKTEGHNFRILPFTSSSLTLLPMQSSWCTDDECANKRGVEIYKSKQPRGFDYTQLDPSSYNHQGNFELPLPYWWSGSQFNTTGNPNGSYGLGIVGLGPSSQESPMLKDVWAVGTPSRDYFMGSFGLGIDSVDPGGSPVTPFMTTYVNASQIPSLSYAYGAGASYRNDEKGVQGSLVLGGYDRSRLVDQRASIPMESMANTTLLVGVQSIIYRPNPKVQVRESSFTADTSTFFAAIDSTLPYLSLPKEICDKFQENFQLEYEEDTKFYKINDTAHNYNKQQDATVTFKIGESKDNDAAAVNIALPYAAFALTADAPLFEDSTRYFPLKRSPNGINVLGRAFLQEAYIIVDYERKNFTVAPAAWTSPLASEDVVPILSPTFTPPPSGPSDDKGGLAPGAIAGIVVGIVAVLGLIGLGTFLWWRRRRAQRAAHSTDMTKDPPDYDTTLVASEEEAKRRRASELDSEPPGSPRPYHPGAAYYDPQQPNKDAVPFPTINEMESPPAELYSPPPPGADSVTVTPGSERDRADYFTAGAKMRRRGATRDSASAGNTPGTPGIGGGAIAELPGDDGGYTVDGQHFEPVVSPLLSPVSPMQTPAQAEAQPQLQPESSSQQNLQQTHNRGPSDSSLQTNIDSVLANSNPTSNPTSHPTTDTRPISPSPAVSPEPPSITNRHHQLERRPSHARGLSDSTVQSDSTGVSGPTPQEEEAWERQRGISKEGRDTEGGGRRPLSE